MQRWVLDSGASGVYGSNLSFTSMKAKHTPKGVMTAGGDVIMSKAAGSVTFFTDNGVSFSIKAHSFDGIAQN